VLERAAADEYPPGGAGVDAGLVLSEDSTLTAHEVVQTASLAFLALIREVRGGEIHRRMRGSWRRRRRPRQSGSSRRRRMRRRVSWGATRWQTAPQRTRRPRMCTSRLVSLVAASCQRCSGGKRRAAEHLRAYLYVWPLSSRGAGTWAGVRVHTPSPGTSPLGRHQPPRTLCTHTPAPGGSCCCCSLPR
jgi:hypothetical protein